MEATTIRYRDSRGRYTRAPYLVEYCTAKGTFVSDSIGERTHAHRDCPEIVDPTNRRTTKHTVREARFFMCSTCIIVPGDDAHPATEAMRHRDDKATKRGCSRCEACEVMRPAPKFPTFEMPGVGWFRDWRVCRACRKGGVTVAAMDPEEMLAA